MQPIKSCNNSIRDISSPHYLSTSNDKRPEKKSRNDSNQVIDSTKSFIFQTMLASAILCVPGNITTLVLLIKQDMDDQMEEKTVKDFTSQLSAK